MLKVSNTIRKHQIIRFFSKSFKKIDAQKTVASPAFDKSDIDEIFNPDLMRKLFRGTGFRYADSLIESNKYREEDIQSQIFDQKLREKIESEKHKYDFKVIRRKLDSQDSDKYVYKT